MIIDCHTHLYEDMSKIHIPEGEYIWTNGTLAYTKEKMKEWGIDKAVVLHVAPNPSQVEGINAFARLILQDDQFICFAAIHPDDENAVSGLDELKASGFKGVKLHPYIQNFEIDHKKVFPIYKALTRLGLPVIIHCGKDHFNHEILNGISEKIAKIHKMFPGLKIVATHLDGIFEDNEEEKYLIGEDIYIDISFSGKQCDCKQFERIIKNHRPDRILFGSDCFYSHPFKGLYFLDKADISVGLKEKILWKNAVKLLNL